MKFEIDTCPLCGASCKPRTTAGIDFFCCPNIEDNGFDQSHYVVQITKIGEIQRIYINPYFIDTFSDSGKSRVYHSNDPEGISRQWKLVMEVPQITAETKDKLLNRLNTLLFFI